MASVTLLCVCASSAERFTVSRRRDEEEGRRSGPAGRAFLSPSVVFGLRAVAAVAAGSVRSGLLPPHIGYRRQLQSVSGTGGRHRPAQAVRVWRAADLL